MPLVLIETTPQHKAIVNTDHIVAVYEVEQMVTIFLTNGDKILVTSPSVADFYDHLGDCVPIL